MGVRQDFERRIARKEQEIGELELTLRDAKTVVQTLQEAMRLLPKDMLEQDTGGRGLRAGSALSKARDAIKKAGKPLHVQEILKALGKPQDKKNRLSLGGSLSAYVRKKDIFTKPAPNTFGLFELESSGPSELPETFGKV